MRRLVTPGVPPGGPAKPTGVKPFVALGATQEAAAGADFDAGFFDDFFVVVSTADAFFSARAFSARPFFLTCALRRFIFNDLRRSNLPMRLLVRD